MFLGSYTAINDCCYSSLIAKAKSNTRNDQQYMYIIDMVKSRYDSIQHTLHILYILHIYTCSYFNQNWNTKFIYTNILLHKGCLKKGRFNFEGLNFVKRKNGRKQTVLGFSVMWAMQNEPEKLIHPFWGHSLYVCTIVWCWWFVNFLFKYCIGLFFIINSPSLVSFKTMNFNIVSRLRTRLGFMISWPHLNCR